MPILICYDGSHRAARAISLARGTLAVDQAILLHVWNPPVAFLADSVGDPGAPGPSMEELEQFSVAVVHHSQRPVLVVPHPSSVSKPV